MPSLFNQSKISTLVPELYEEFNKKYTKYWDTKYLILQSSVEALQRGLEPILTLHSTIENRETTSKTQKLFWDKNIDEALLFPGYFSLVREYFSFAASLRSSSLWSILTCHSFLSLWSWNGHNIGLLVSGDATTSFWDSIPNFLSQPTVGCFNFVQSKYFP